MTDKNYYVKKGSKFTNKYGLTVKEIAEKLNMSVGKVYSLDHLEKLKDLLKPKTN